MRDTRGRDRKCLQNISLKLTKEETNYSLEHNIKMNVKEIVYQSASFTYLEQDSI
jgi:hypothetical protein